MALRSAVGFWIGLTVFGLVGLVAYQLAAAVGETGVEVEQGQRVVDALAAERVALSDAAAMRRAYAFTRDETFRAGYSEAVARVSESGRVLGELTRGRARQAQRWARLDELIRKRLAALDAVVAATRAGALEPRQDAAAIADGQQADREVWRDVADFASAERGLLALQHDATSKKVRHIRLFVVLGTGLGGLLLLATFGQLRNEVQKRIRSERAARDSEESLATTLMSIGDGVIATDVEGRVERMNRVAEELTGWELGSALGRPVAEVFRTIDAKRREPLEDPVSRTLRVGAPTPLDEQALLVRRNDEELSIGDSCAPVRDARDRLRGAVLVFRDTSEAERARQLQAAAQSQMIFSDRMVAVGTLAAGVAHEINNPLTYVISNLELMLEALPKRAAAPVDGDEIRGMANDALEGARRVAKIVRGMKTFARADAPHTVVMDLHAVLELAIGMTSNELRHRARLVRAYGRVPLVEGDEGRLGQVFVNLLVNAAQAIPEGDVGGNEIRVATSTDVAGRAVVEFQDSGTGIPPAIVGRIFEPFFTTKAVGVGTGLGLSICHNIVTAMGGEIAVDSEPSRGTTFRITLPASSGALSAPLQRQQREASGSGAEVLIVDDEPRLAAVLARLLDDHRLTAVTNARQAIELIEQGHNFDLILSDLMMPEMSGMEFYEYLARAHPRLLSRVVFLTGGAFTPAAKAFLDRVDNVRLEKPFGPAELRALVKDALVKSRRVRPVENGKQEA